MRIAALCLVLVLSGCAPRIPPQALQPPVPPQQQAVPTPPVDAPAPPLVVIDAGHGGHDDGAKCKHPSFPEKRAALQLALLLQRQLVSLGYRVALTRSQDHFLALHERAALANQRRAQLFVSLHFNHCANPQASGIEVFFHNHEPVTERDLKSRALAQMVLKGAIDATQARERGVKEAGFVVIRTTQMPSILVEGGFLSNRDEGTAIGDLRYLERLSKGLAAGIHRYFSTPEEVLYKSPPKSIVKATAPAKAKVTLASYRPAIDRGQPQTLPGRFSLTKTTSGR